MSWSIYHYSQFDPFKYIDEKRFDSNYRLIVQWYEWSKGGKTANKEIFEIELMDNEVA